MIYNFFELKNYSLFSLLILSLFIFIILYKYTLNITLKVSIKSFPISPSNIFNIYGTRIASSLIKYFESK